MSFQFFDPANIEFGVCQGQLADAQFATVPVDQSVKTLLEQMVLATRTSLGLTDARPVIARYELSEQYPSEVALALPLNDLLVRRIRQLYDAGSIPVNSRILDNVKDVTAYFCIIHDQDGNKLLALKRATQFKAILKRRLIRILDDTLQAIEHSVFQLDPDFDVLVTDGNHIHTQDSGIRAVGPH